MSLIFLIKRLFSVIIRSSFAGAKIGNFERFFRRDPLIRSALLQNLIINRLNLHHFSNLQVFADRSESNPGRVLADNVQRDKTRLYFEFFEK